MVNSHTVCTNINKLYHISEAQIRPNITRPRRCRSAEAYSRQTFPWTICRSIRMCVRTYVRPSVCPVHCGKTADRIRMPFGIIGRTGPGIRQAVEFGDRSTGRGIFFGGGANLGRAIVTNGNFTAYVCDSAATQPSSQITLGRLVDLIEGIAGVNAVRMLPQPVLPRRMLVTHLINTGCRE